MTIPDRRLSTAEVQDLMRPLENDLVAFYRLVSDAAEDLLDKAVREGWTPEQLIDELDRMIGGDNRAAETTAVPALEDLRVNKARRLDGRMDFQGLPISIENAAGSTRSGVDQDGHPWSVTMLSPYGYVRGTEGVDGDAVDVFVGPNIESQLVFVIHTKNPDGSYDEDKCMLGYNSEDEARASIEANYSRPIVLSIDTLTLDKFREKLETREGKKITAPRTVAKEAAMPEAIPPAAQRFIKEARALGVDPVEFYAGILAESKEHDVSFSEGAKIALDHLRKEDPQYYTKLQEAGL